MDSHNTFVADVCQNQYNVDDQTSWSAKYTCVGGTATMTMYSDKGCTVPHNHDVMTSHGNCVTLAPLGIESSFKMTCIQAAATSAMTWNLQYFIPTFNDPLIWYKLSNGGCHDGGTHSYRITCDDACNAEQTKYRSDDCTGLVLSTESIAMPYSFNWRGGSVKQFCSTASAPDGVCTAPTPPPGVSYAAGCVNGISDPNWRDDAGNSCDSEAISATWCRKYGHETFKGHGNCALDGTGCRYFPKPVFKP